MLTYNQRYRPRMEREYTKTDLTVYDSAGNTALRGLKVYGKSEVVDGAITSAGDSGSIEIEICEKNLFDPIKLVTENITYTDGTLSGTAPHFSQAFRYGTPILFNNKRQVTFSLNAYTNGLQQQGRGLLFSFVYKDNTTDTLNIPNSTIEPQFFTLTSNPTKQIQYISITYGVGEYNTWYLSKIQLEYGSSATTYEAYNGTMAVFSTGTPLRGIPDSNVRDAMAWDGSAGTVTKNCGEVDLGTRIWTEYGSTAEYTRYVTGGIDDKVKDNGNCLCAKYNSRLPTQSIEPNMVWISSGNAKLSVTTNVNEYASASDFTAAMSGVKLVYELATPTTEQLTTAENDSIAGLRTFDGTTHIQNNASTDMTVNYTIKVPTIS